MSCPRAPTQVHEQRPAEAGSGSEEMAATTSTACKMMANPVRMAPSFLAVVWLKPEANRAGIFLSPQTFGWRKQVIGGRFEMLCDRDHTLRKF
jgi:hypothetical protein